MHEDVSKLPDGELRELMQQSRQTIQSLSESFLKQPEMLSILHLLMNSEDMLQATMNFAGRDPKCVRTVLQACVAAMVNTQNVAAFDAELKRRAPTNN